MFNYVTDQPDHLISICDKMRDHDRGLQPYHVTSNTTANPIYPLRALIYPNDRVLVSGSIHKYSNKENHCNDTDFSLKQAINTIEEICDTLKIDLHKTDPKITSIEVGVNIRISIPVIEFLKTVGKYKFCDFSYSKPMSGSTRKWGKELRMTDYDIKFYDKSYLTNKELKHIKYPKENLLRFEIRFTHHIKRYLNFDSISGLIKNAAFIPILIGNVINHLTFKKMLSYTMLDTDEILTCEAFNNDEFYNNIQSLSRGTKLRLKKKYEAVLKKYSGKDYSNTVYIRLKRKILFLSK